MQIVIAPTHREGKYWLGWHQKSAKEWQIISTESGLRGRALNDDDLVVVIREGMSKPGMLDTYKECCRLADKRPTVIYVY